MISTPVRYAGFFRELGHGRPDDPSIREVRGAIAAAETRARIASYLRSGRLVATTSANVDDVFDPSRRGVAPLRILTDGEWVWPADLAYYVEEYGCGLPPDFITHMARYDWHMPNVTHQRVANVIQAIRPSRSNRG